MNYKDLNRIEIDLKAVCHNLNEIKRLLKATRAGIIAVVKSDAYGHGLVEVSRVLETAGVWGFGISDIEEAALLRSEGITAPILLISGLPPESEQEVFGLDLIVGVTDVPSLEALEHAGAARDETCRVHLKVDTGMGRMGFSSHELYEIVKRPWQWPHLNPEGLYSHLSSADDPFDPFNSVQLNAFSSVLQEVKKIGWNPLTVHLANSAGLIHFPSIHYDLVRPGIAIYGSYPGPEGQKDLDLRPVMSFSSKVIAVHRFPEGSPISYGHYFHTKKPSKIAVLPVGYYDGYLRSVSGKSWVLIRGRRCPVVGRICMKHFMVDVSDLDGIAPGEEVVLLGRQRDEIITVEELARWGNTISYEVLCLLGTRNKRSFKG